MRLFVMLAVLTLFFLPVLAQYQTTYVGGDFGKKWLKTSGNTAGDLWTWGSLPKYEYNYYPYYYVGYGGYGNYGGWLPYMAYYPRDFYTPDFANYPWGGRTLGNLNIYRYPQY
ncbi:MAG: hypothetical protein MUO26_12485 [Methanotrichaceae archaeon]|nr:hypothetical protein [Methanotrichaceae archaeon]